MPEYVNKDYYRQLAPDDRSFLNLSAQNIRNVMDRLNAENIMFSATVGYKNTITVSKADRERALAIVNSLSDQNRSTARIIGNVPYKELPPSERKYINTDTETALQVANIIAGDSSMKFSGRISGNNATLTVVGEKNAATVRRIIDNIQNMDLVNELREKGYERIADTNGFVNIRNMQTGETAGFESLREARNMFLDPDNEFFHPTEMRIEENTFFRIVSDEPNMDYYISEYDPETNEERAVYLDDEGRCPTFSSVDEALEYAAAHSIDYTNTENQLEHWRADDEERAADRERYENNIIIQTKFPHVDNRYPNDIIYNPDSKAFSWVYFNEEGDGGDGEFIDITVTEDDVLAAYNSENFLEYIYQNCKQNVIDTHSGYFEDYANAYINPNNDIVRRYQELTIQAYLEEHTPAVQKAKKSLEGEISTDSDSLIIDGYEGTWYVVDTETVDGKELFLLENENYGDETFGIIIDKDRNVLVDEAWNGFSDYHEKYDNLTPEEKLANKVAAEWKEFLEGMKKESPAVLIESAYEISTKDNIQTYITEEKLDLTEKQINALLSRDNVLDELYDDWNHNEFLNSYSDVADLLNDTANAILVSEGRLQPEIADKQLEDVFAEIHKAMADEGFKGVREDDFDKFVVAYKEHLSNIVLNGEYPVLADLVFGSSSNTPDPWQHFEDSVYHDKIAANMNEVYDTERKKEIENLLLFRKENRECANMIDAVGSKHYENNTFKTEAALDELLERYSFERIQAIAAANVVELFGRLQDRRVSQQNYEWGRTVLDNLPERFRAELQPIGANRLTMHPGLINLFANRIREYEAKSIEQRKNIEASKYYIDNMLDVNVESMYFDPETESIHWYELDPHGDDENGVFNEYIIDKDFAREAVEHNDSEEIIGYVDGNSPNQNTAVISSQDFVKMADEHIRISEIAASGEDDNYITIDHSSDDDVNKVVADFFRNKFGLTVAPERTAEDIAVGDKYRYKGAVVEVVSMKGIYPNDVGISKKERTGSTEYAVTSNVDKYELHRNGEFLGNGEKTVVSELDMAKKYIEDFLDSEFSSTADFSDMKHIAIGYTEIGSEKQGDHSLQMEADLESFSVSYYIDDELAKTEKYDSLEQMNRNHLSVLNFEDMLHVGTTELDRILEEKAAAVSVVLAVSQNDTNRYYIANDVTEETVKNIIADSEKLFMDLCALGGIQITEAEFAKYSQTEGIKAIDINIDEQTMHVYGADKPITSFAEIKGIDEIAANLDLANNTINFSVITIEGEKPFVTGSYVGKDDITALEEYQEYIAATGKQYSDVTVEFYQIGGDNESVSADDRECAYISEHLQEVMGHSDALCLESDTYSVRSPQFLIDDYEEMNEEAETELAFKMPNGGYISIFERSDEGYDYTIYNENYDEIDSGVYDDDSITIRNALANILDDERVYNELEEIDFASLTDMVEKREHNKSLNLFDTLEYDVNKVFAEFITSMDFTVVKVGDEYSLRDDANLGNIHSDRFDSAMAMTDRLDVYIEDYYIYDTLSLIKSNGLEDILTDDSPNLGQIYEDIKAASGDERVQKFFNEYRSTMEIIDLICNRIEDVDISIAFKDAPVEESEIKWTPIPESADDNGNPTSFSTKYRGETFFISENGDGKYDVEFENMRHHGQTYHAPINEDFSGFLSRAEAEEYFADNIDEYIAVRDEKILDSIVSNTTEPTPEEREEFAKKSNTLNRFFNNNPKAVFREIVESAGLTPTEDITVGDTKEIFNELKSVDILLMGYTYTLEFAPHDDSLTVKDTASHREADFVWGHARELMYLIANENNISRENLIHNEVMRGTGFEDGKFRVEEFYKNNPSKKDFADFLKKEFGIGGHSGEGPVRFADHDSKGIEITTTSGKENFTWSEVAKVISDLLDKGEYITQKDIDRRIYYAKVVIDNANENTDFTRLIHAHEVLQKYGIEKPEPDNEYKIYQLKKGPENHAIRFEGFANAERYGEPAKPENYDLVYTGSLDDFEDSNKLEAIYTKFNLDRPEDFKGHSLSVSDIIVMNNEAHYDMRDEKGNYILVVNQEETKAVRQVANLIKSEFQDWIFKDPERREKLVQTYNEMYNSIRPREYDGSHLNFVGMNTDITLKEHQKNAIARALYGGNTLLAHAVGAGKTFEMIAIAMEGKRLGLHTKSLFAVPNSLTEQMGNDFRRLYPNANILVATKKDFEKENRLKLFAKIAANDWDAVIVGHTQFDRMGLSPDREQQYITAELEKLREELEYAAEYGEKSFSVKKIEKAIASYQDRLNKLNDAQVKDDFIDFEKLGFDKLFIDECHLYKNLATATKMHNVSGLGSGGAARSFNLLMKSKYMDEITGGKGQTYASGTPISNSMCELYTMMRYLQADMLKDCGINHFDEWAADFGEVKTDYELKPESDGKYQLKTRFAKFTNLPELMGMFKECADIRTADTLDLEKPDAHFHEIVAEPSRTQKKLIKSLSKRATAIRDGKIDPREDNMLVITNDGRKIGLDQRLINPILEDEEGSKVNLCVNNVYDIYSKTTDKRSTQCIFCDMSTPKSDSRQDRFEVYRPNSSKELGYELLRKKIGLGNGDEDNPKNINTFVDVKSYIDKHSPDQSDKLSEGDIVVIRKPNMDNGKIYSQAAIFEDGKLNDVNSVELLEKLLMSDVEDIPPKEFNVYDDIKGKLMNRGVPEEEIAFIHDYETAEQKQKLFDKMNAGEVRILLGSTQKCGAGMNAQAKMIALHHLDCPLRPSDVEHLKRNTEKHNRTSRNILNKYAQNQITNAEFYVIYQYRRISSHPGKIYGGIVSPLISLDYPPTILYNSSNQKSKPRCKTMEEKTITFISERKTYTLPISSILYIMMKKQDAFVHVSDGSVLKTRMTFAEFQKELGEDFIRIHRGCLVSAKAIHSVNQLLTLSNGDSLEYSALHREEIIEKFHKKQRIIVEELMNNDNPTVDDEYHEHYKCFDNIPIAFTDIEMVFDEDSQAVDWIFRYGNEALARLENCPLDKLIGSSFGSIFVNMDSKWLRTYERAVLYGETLELIDYSPEIDKFLRIICFPTFKGHCGCMLFDISDDKMPMENAAGDRAVLMYLRKMMN